MIASYKHVLPEAEDVTDEDDPPEELVRIAELAGALVEEAATTVVAAELVGSVGVDACSCVVAALLAVVVTRHTAMHAEYNRNKLFTHTSIIHVYCSCKRKKYSQTQLSLH